MKKIILFFGMLPILSFSQMQPADSLPGEYVGEYWYANPYNSPWVITPETLYANNIDSINCKIQVNWAHPGYPTYYTDYYSCNSTEPLNYYTKFYSTDSFRIIENQVPMPPPNSPISYRFYGKRISNKTIGINEQLNSEQVKVFPNPCNDVLNIESKKQVEEITITDLIGREIKNERLKSQIDVSNLQDGVYFVSVKTEKGMITKKIVVQH